MMMTCKHVCDHASDFINGPMISRQRLLLRLHLVICKHCRLFLAQFGLASRAGCLATSGDTPTDAEIDALIALLREV